MDAEFNIGDHLPDKAFKHSCIWGFPFKNKKGASLSFILSEV